MRHLRVGWLVVLLGMAACDDVRLVEEGGGGAPEPIVQSEVVHSRLSTDGIESLYEAAHGDGLTVAHETRRHRLDDHSLTFGPISQTVPVDNLQVSSREDRLELMLVRENPAVAVPVRLEEHASVRICRFQVAADKLIATAEASHQTAGDWKFEVASAPAVSLVGRDVNAINPCPPLENEAGDPIDSLRKRLTRYVETAVQRGVGNYAAVSFIETLGILRGTTALRRISAFGNRRGTLRLASRPAEDGVELDPKGTSLSLDMGVSARRAACVPPDDLPAIDDSRPAERIEPAQLEGRRIEGGFALAEPLLARMLGATTLGGFLCRGLDSETSSDSRRIARHRARLEAVGLDEIPGAGPVESVVNPGGLPTLDLRPRDGSLAMKWTGLSIDLYGDVAGTRVRLLSVTANLALRLRPSGSSSDAVDLSISTLDVQQASMQTPWSDADVDRTTLLRWTKRLLILVFEDSFSLPLPVAPGSPIELAETHVRNNDLLLLFRVR